MRARTCIIALAAAFALVALSGVGVFVHHTQDMRQERRRTDAAAVIPGDDPWPECAAVRKHVGDGKEIVTWERRGVLNGQTIVKVRARDTKGTPRTDYYTTIVFGLGPEPSIQAEMWGPFEESFWTPWTVYVLLNIGLGGVALCALVGFLKRLLPERAFRFVGLPLALLLATAYGVWILSSGLGPAQVLLSGWARSEMAMWLWHD